MAYQLYNGLLFGLPLAVTSFNRYSRLCEALGRRLCFTLVSMYFDDAHITDWASSKGSGQHSFEVLNQLLGTPFAPEKRQPMHSKGTFLGLDHDFTESLRTGMVFFWAREKLQEKLRHLMQDSLESDKFTSGQAAKLYGLANFCEQGIFGRVGNGILQAVKDRQYERERGLTSELRSCFQMLEAILQAKPRREFPIISLPIQRFSAASDAALEAPFCGTGGFLIVWHSYSSESREAFVADIPPAIYDLWTPGDKKIAQLELCQALYALVNRPAKFRGRRGVWFIDNLAALMALIKGRSDSPDLERLAHLIHMACFSLRVWIYWEYIPSKSNWADAISRLGANDPWHRAHNFTLSQAHLPLILWRLPFPAVVLIFEMI